MESELVQSNLPCPDCGSSDALAEYDDGHTYCFSCNQVRQPEGLASGNKEPDFEAVSGEPRALRKRGLTEETCRKWGYWCGNGKQIANYRDRSGALVAQKLRDKDKKFSIRKGKDTKLPLFGTHLWRDSGRKIVITEGEIDAMSVSQAQGNKWPVVSLPNGCASARKTLAAQLEWLETFEEVILMFDNDDAGHEAVEKCVDLFTPGRVKVAQLPESYKDPNEMLVAGREKEIIDAIWGAKVWRPDGIITAADVSEEALKPEEFGLSWPWKELTDITYGIRRRECYAFGAGTGVGKTDCLTEVIAHLLEEHEVPVGLLFLEQSPAETVKRVAGKIAGKPFHVPDGNYTTEELHDAVTRVSDSGRLFLYDHFGSIDWPTVRSRIRYMVQSLGVRDIFLDHLTALASQADDERRELEGIMADIGSLVQELGFTLYFVSHLATPDGKAHEEGGRVMIRHFKGSRSIGFWSNFMFGLERDQQSEDKRDVTTFRVLKDRKTGRANGKTFALRYDHDTGRMFETDEVFEDEEGEF